MPSFNEFSIGGLPIPAGANAKADYDLKGWIWTLGGGWHAVTDPSATAQQQSSCKRWSGKAR